MILKPSRPYVSPECEVVPILSEGVVCDSFDVTTIETFDETDFVY